MQIIDERFAANFFSKKQFNSKLFSPKKLSNLEHFLIPQTLRLSIEKNIATRFAVEHDVWFMFFFWNFIQTHHVLKTKKKSFKWFFIKFFFLPQNCWWQSWTQFIIFQFSLAAFHYSFGTKMTHQKHETLAMIDRITNTSKAHNVIKGLLKLFFGNCRFVAVYEP